MNTQETQRKDSQLSRIEERCRQIGLLPEVTERVVRTHAFLRQVSFYEKNRADMEMLIQPHTEEEWDAARLRLHAALAEVKADRGVMSADSNPQTDDKAKADHGIMSTDSDSKADESDGRGLGMLTVMIALLEKTADAYQRAGIPEWIFVDTMKCFARFVKEYKSAYGACGFDRDFWTPRQLSCLLFRIGELEYELLPDNRIGMHIPSDTVLTREMCEASLAEAQTFIKQYFPKWQDASYVCHSWLLAPALKEILNPQSHILCFQKAFRILSVDEEDLSCLEWVYGRENISYEALPERTSLQRNMKRYLLAGKKIGSAMGVLCNPSFQI